MNMEPTNPSEENLDYRELVKPYVKNWKWFVVSVLCTVVLGLLYMRYTVPKYAVQAKIQILEDEKGPSQLNVFEDLGVFGEGGTQVEDEIQLLTSRSSLMDLVKELGLNISITGIGKIRNTSIYRNPGPPFNINFLAPDSVLQNSRESFFIKLSSNKTSFEFAEKDSGPFKVYSFGNTISSPVGDIIITPNNSELNNGTNTFVVSVNPVSAVAVYYQNILDISVDNPKSRIITILLEDALITRAEDIINKLISIYNRNGIDDKRAMAFRTSDFIDERIDRISISLTNVDQSAVNFKSDRGLSDLGTQNTLNLDLGAQTQQQLQDASIQLDIATSMKDIIDSDQGYGDLLPSNIGLEDVSIAATAQRYNELALERKRLLESSNDKNPIIVNLDQQLAGLKRNMRSSLNGMTNNLTLQVNDLSKRLSTINSRIYSAPRNERALRDIARQQETTESLYLYLLEKREEAQIAFASSTAKSKVVDNAYSVSDFPVSPKLKLVLFVSLLFGLLVPFSFIYLNYLLDNKVHNKIGLEKLVGNIPVLAELPKITKRENTLVKPGERTVLAESLRILRTNLDYIIKSKKNTSKSNIIFITSSVPGEGKTFIASNLAMVFANTDKKVLLIGADIRNPKIYQFYSGKHIDKLGNSYRNKDNKGLTEYLVDSNIGYKDIISSMLAYDLTIDIIYSGKIPPNPSDLLMSDRISELLENVKRDYDYVVVDTAPLMVVSDTLLLSEYADQLLYVTRAGFTELKVLDFPMKLYKEGKLKGISFVVNDVKSSNLGYGRKYGYGYGVKTKKWWKF